jgi:hypothetical protein
LRFPYPPSRYGISYYRSPAIAYGVLRCTAHNGHTQRTWRTVPSSMPQRHFASSTTPIRDRYWFGRQCPVRAWIRIDACYEVNVPYRHSVCRPGRAWSSFHVYWPGRPSVLKRARSLFRSFSIRRITPAGSRILPVSGAVDMPSWLVTSRAPLSASVFPQTPAC